MWIAVFSHFYGAQGGEIRKVDASHFMFDFDVLIDMMTNEFIENLKSKLERFIDRLIAAKIQGMTIVQNFLFDITLFINILL